jgi:membrane dipeptidase
MYRLPVFDLHCDTPHNIAKRKFNHIYPGRLHGQNYLGAVFAHFIDPRNRMPFASALRLLSSTVAYIKNSKGLRIVSTAKEIKRQRVNIVLGVEGGHIFDRSIRQFEMLYAMGVRVFTLTWNNSNRLASSALDQDGKGMTRYGKDFIKQIRGFDIIIDLSHASKRTVLDCCERADNQVIASHSCLRAMRPDFLRNIDDRAIKAIQEKGGVVGINFSRYHLGGYSVADHIDYLTDRFGVDLIAIGSDFDGINDAVYSGPKAMSILISELISRGYKRGVVEKIFFKNFLRVLKKIS